MPAHAGTLDVDIVIDLQLLADTDAYHSLEDRLVKQQFAEWSGTAPRQGHIPKARHLEVDRLFAGPGRPVSPELIVKLTGLPPDAEIVCYCHSGARSALAVLALRAAGYNVRNYTGSWHEWSRHSDLPLEK